MAFDPVRIEEKIDRTAATSIEVSTAVGGIRFQNMLEVMETAKMLSLSGPILPKWLQNNPGGCWAILIQASEWGLSPISVAQMSFEVNGVVRYMSQLIHALIEARAPLSKRLRGDYEGEGDNRLCVVTGYMNGEVEPFVLRSPPISKITPKNSPLWKSDPDQQLWYYATRAWARRYCPEALLGVYGDDEATTIETTATEVKPDIGSRLPGAGKAKGGFSAEHVERETAPKGGRKAVAAPETPADTASPATAAPASSEGDSNANPPNDERLALDVAAQQPGGFTDTAAAQEAAITRAGLSSDDEATARGLQKLLSSMTDAVEIQSVGEATLKQHGAAGEFKSVLLFVINHNVKRARGEKKWTAGAVEDAVEDHLMRASGRMDDLLA